MAWGKSKPAPPSPSVLRQLLPLIVTLIFLGVAAWVGYQIYVSVGKIKEQAEKQMGDKNLVFTKDGLRVSVKEVNDESLVDSTQSWFVKAWNLSGNQPDNTKRKRFGQAPIFGRSSEMLTWVNRNILTKHRSRSRSPQL
ncbi:hypothetical protein QBC38DRAFT_475822 [Podospora fimiseda]|uniref:Uncharacterized protein n=1 Tax=Podospora fimiseda TaxID=252190 RepID=A0AAN7H3H7_9PEZI|nr:hypothetical protein QBC38DRAFT_475822 [Podospora fimiseda]